MSRPRIELLNRRKAKGWTALQTVIEAGADGPDEMRLYSIERGRCDPKPREALALARVLGVKVETLFPELTERAGR